MIEVQVLRIESELRAARILGAIAIASNDFDITWIQDTWTHMASGGATNEFVGLLSPLLSPSKSKLSKSSRRPIPILSSRVSGGGGRGSELRVELKNAVK